MSAVMLTATIAVPADRVQPIAFERGRRMIEKIQDVVLFRFDDPEIQLEGLVDDFDPDVHLDAAGAPTFDAAKRASRTIIDRLEEALSSGDTITVTVAGYLIYLSGGLSWGDAPTDAAEAIWNSYLLPEAILQSWASSPTPAVRCPTPTQTPAT